MPGTTPPALGLKAMRNKPAPLSSRLRPENHFPDLKPAPVSPTASDYRYFTLTDIVIN